MPGSDQAMKNALAGSLKELLRTRTLERISTEEICRNAKVSRRSFYRHFPDKYALLDWIYYTDFCMDNEHHDDWVIWDYFPSICEHLYSDREFYRHAFQTTGQNSFREFCYGRLYPLLHHDFHGAFESKKEEEFYLKKTTDAMFDDFVRWLKSEPCMPPDEYADMIRKSIGRFAAILAETSTRPLAGGK